MSTVPPGDPPVAAAGQPAPTGAPRPVFAHASEAELARILDFYDVRWAYEPDTVPIGGNLADFYLPDLDLYVELTTLKQKLVRKKNRKLRRLRELYPDVRIKLFYARDFRALLLKFGRLALVDELTGTSGQATPPRPAGDRAPGVVAGTGPVGAADRAAAASPTASPTASPGKPLPPAVLVTLAEEPRSRRRPRRRRRGHGNATAVPPPAAEAEAPGRASP
jgi:hypothetical protein